MNWNIWWVIDFLGRCDPRWDQSTLIDYNLSVITVPSFDWLIPMLLLLLWENSHWWPLRPHSSDLLLFSDDCWLLTCVIIIDVVPFIDPIWRLLLRLFGNLLLFIVIDDVIHCYCCPTRLMTDVDSVLLLQPRHCWPTGDKPTFPFGDYSPVMTHSALILTSIVDWLTVLTDQIDDQWYRYWLSIVDIIQWLLIDYWPSDDIVLLFSIPWLFNR